MRATVQHYLVIMTLMLVVGGGSLAWQSHTATPAHAAACSGQSCNDLDPATTLCNQNSRRQDHKDIIINNVNYGWVENWYSFSCNANWTVVQANNGAYLLSALMYTCPSMVNGACQTQTTFQYADLASGWGDCTYVVTCHPGAFGKGNTFHWYTNMVNGSLSVMSMVEVQTPYNGYQQQRTNWA